MFPQLNIQLILKKGTSLAVQWLRLHASTAEGMDSIPGWGTKDPVCCVAVVKKIIIITYTKHLLNKSVYVRLICSFSDVKS